MKIQKTGVLIFSLFLPLLAGFVGSLFTVNSIPTWYAGLTKPFFTPPSWLFAPAWTTLYLLMGTAFYRVLIKVKNPLQNRTVQFFLVHLAVNAGWSIVFFGLKYPGAAMAVIVLLWVTIVYLIKLFSKVDKLAGQLLWPYLAWVTFASLLNYSVWRLN